MLGVKTGHENKEHLPFLKARLYHFPKRQLSLAGAVINGAAIGFKKLTQWT